MKKQIEVNQKVIGLILAFVLVFAGGYQMGRSGYVAQQARNTPLPIIGKDKNRPDAVDFSLFWDAWNIVQDKYVKPVDNQERLYGAIAGQVASLGDPFSLFMKPSENKQFSQELQGDFQGIGAELVQKDGFITVVAPLEDSPAAKAGLKANDIIVKINGKDAPTDLQAAVDQIRGPKGTNVTLGIVRDNKPQDITITRDDVVIKSVHYTLNGTMGVIKINEFSENTTSLLDDALAQAQKDKVKGLVLDLRDNPGGLLNVAVDVTSRFISGPVVIERDRAGKEVTTNTNDVSNRTTLPAVILVNGGSASASEIFAGALQDAGRAKVIGEKTFGKGSVQSIEPLKDGSSIRITIAEWLTPKKRAINKVGLNPDEVVKRTDDDIKAGRDPQMDKALSELASQ